jgi:hypothetical protein
MTVFPPVRAMCIEMAVRIVGWLLGRNVSTEATVDPFQQSADDTLTRSNPEKNSERKALLSPCLLYGRLAPALPLSRSEADNRT